MGIMGRNKMHLISILIVAATALIPVTHSEDSAACDDSYDTAPSTKVNTAKGYINAVIAEINYYRVKHGVCPVTFNEKLSEIAQNWADHLAREDKLEPSKTECLGETLAKQWSTEPWKIDSFFAPEKWYDDEIHNYDFSTGESNGEDIGNVTQMLWKATREVGLAYRSYSKGRWTKYVVVAEYYPAGTGNNTEMTENLFPEGSPLPEECKDAHAEKPDSVYGELNNGSHLRPQPLLSLVLWNSVPLFSVWILTALSRPCIL